MKAILICLLITQIFGCTASSIAQSYPGDPSDYNKLTNEPSDKAKTYFEVYDWSNPTSPKIYIIPYESLEEFFAISGDQTITDNWAFTEAVQLGLDPSSATERAIKFISTASGLRLSYSTLGANYVVPNMDDLTAIGVGDTNDFPRKSSTNIYSGQNIFNSGIEIGDQTLISLGRIPSGYEFGGYGLALGEGGEIISKWRDWNNDKGQDTIATTKDIRSIQISSGGNAIIAAGIQSGITSAITRTGGGTVYTGTADASVHMYGLHEVPYEHVPGKIYGKFTLGFSELFLQSSDSNNDDITHSYPETPYVQYMIDETLKFSEPVAHNTASDSLDFGSSDPVAGKFGSQSLQTIYLKNYQPNFIVSCYVQSGEGVVFDFGAVTIKWLNGILPPAFTDQKIWVVAFQYYNATTVLGSYAYYE